MKITNIDVGVEFDALLRAHPFFSGDNYKLIPTCEYLLMQIHQTMVFYEKDTARVSYDFIRDLFQSHDVNVTELTDVLKEIGLLNWNKSEAGGKSYEVGRNSTKYYVTDICIPLLQSTNQKNLRKLHNDPVTINRFKNIKKLVIGC